MSEKPLKQKTFKPGGASRKSSPDPVPAFRLDHPIQTALYAKLRRLGASSARASALG